MVRKNPLTQAFIQRGKAHLLSFYRRKDPDFTLADVEASVFQDEHLVGFSVAMNAWDLEKSILEIEQDGCVRSVDFVVTSSVEGVLDDPLPTWLSVELKPVIDSPEQLTAMDPVFREALERQSPRTTRFYSFNG